MAATAVGRGRCVGALCCVWLLILSSVKCSRSLVVGAPAPLKKEPPAALRPGRARGPGQAVRKNAAPNPVRVASAGPVAKESATRQCPISSLRGIILAARCFIPTPPPSVARRFHQRVARKGSSARVYLLFYPKKRPRSVGWGGRATRGTNRGCSSAKCAMLRAGGWTRSCLGSTRCHAGIGL